MPCLAVNTNVGGRRGDVRSAALSSETFSLKRNSCLKLCPDNTFLLVESFHRATDQQRYRYKGRLLIIDPTPQRAFGVLPINSTKIEIVSTVIHAVSYSWTVVGNV
jgi:hypothetical protein